VKLPGTYRRRAWGTVSAGTTNSLPETRSLTDMLTEVYELGPLEPDSYYTEPDKGDTTGLKCDCNTIIYRLVHIVLPF
jgi:hypothetical protein